LAAGPLRKERASDQGDPLKPMMPIWGALSIVYDIISTAVHIGGCALPCSDIENGFFWEEDGVGCGGRI
jgi:hypothetical protein